MAGFRLPSFKSLANLSGISARVSTGPQHFQQLKKFQNLVQHRHRSSTASSVNISSERINDNVVYSRHEDCFLHTQTMVQRFFEQASLWPNHTAVVSRLISLLFIKFFEEQKLRILKHVCVNTNTLVDFVTFKGKAVTGINNSWPHPSSRVNLANKQNNPNSNLVHVAKLRFRKLFSYYVLHYSSDQCHFGGFTL